MSTNYYVLVNTCPHPCEHCKRTNVRVHLGMSAVGWLFLCRAYPHGHDADPDAEVRTIVEWTDLAYSGKIVDEYDKEISHGDFFGMVIKKQSERNVHETDVYTSGGFLFCAREFS